MSSGNRHENEVKFGNSLAESSVEEESELHNKTEEEEGDSDTCHEHPEESHLKPGDTLQVHGRT